MNALKPFILTAFLLACTGQAVQAQSCKPISQFEGLFFDAGAFVGDQNMERSLENALVEGVEKVVLFPAPVTQPANRPRALEKVFPDLVLRGASPWSKASPVIWPEPLDITMFGSLADEMARHPDRTYLISHLSRFDPKQLSKLLDKAPNLWLGLSGEDLKILNKQCANGPLQSLVDQADGRLVFASFGQDRHWQNYKKTIQSLRNYIALLSEEKSEAIAFRNAEHLYKVAVNAP
ncbi:hypothetical protein [Terasakiella sp.]|uniref:hypothetical protein n=1 Tax=Terasakiella sp. TaxID=2034861 RepID=UPI003AA82861